MNNALCLLRSKSMWCYYSYALKKKKKKKKNLKREVQNVIQTLN